ncbi:MAG: Flp family type IVb pilin [Actinomycetes bacterium]
MEQMQQRIARALLRAHIALRSGGEAGATSVEYAIIASLIAAVIIGAVGLLGLATERNFRDLTDLTSAI